MSRYIAEAAEQFVPKGKITGIHEYGKGNINRTFLVTFDSRGEEHFVLQCINTQVFRHPELVMKNMRIFTEHMQNRLQNASPPGRRWEIPLILSTRDGRESWIDHEGSFWRAITFIEGSRSFDIIQDIEHAKEVGFALGIFHDLLCDLPPDRVADTLKGFHITPLYLEHYSKVLVRHGPYISPEVDHCLQFIHKRSAFVNVLEKAKTQGKLLLRMVHGDPKVNNIMIDTATGKAVSIVDLDTVKPGLVHYDIGDCLRSSCNLLGEETEQWDKVQFDLTLFHAVLQGYISIARKFLTIDDLDYLYDAVRLLSFELGLRFFTDFLEGNVYFRVRHPEHNLIRALVQFKLTESIELQERDIRNIIKDLDLTQQY